MYGNFSLYRKDSMMSQQFPPYGQQQPYGQSQPSYYPPSQPTHPGYVQPASNTPQSPKKQRSLAWLWIIAIIAMFFVGFGAGASMRSTATTTNTATATNTTDSTTQPANTHHKLNESVSVDAIWQVTVNSVKTSQGSDFTSPKSGNTFLLISVSMKNISGSQQTASTIIQWSLRDATGQKYDETIVSGTTGPEGNVAAGDPLIGTLAYEVPTATKTFVLDFVSSIGGQQVSWDIGA